MVDLLDIGFKSMISNILKYLKKTMYNKLKETSRTIYLQIENINKE